MRRTVCLLLFVCAPALGDGGVSFVHLVNTAAGYDTRLAARRVGVEAKESAVAAARGVFYPQLSLLSGYNTIERYNRRGSDSYLRYALSVNQLIIDRKRRYDYLAAEEDVTAETYAVQSLVQSLYREVIQARLDLHAAEESRRLLESRLQAIEERLHLVTRRQSGGVGTFLDVALVQAERGTVKADLEAAQTEKENARQSLFALTSIMAVELPGLRQDFSFPPLPPLAVLQDTGARNNPVLRATTHQVETQRLRERSSLANQAPSVSLTGERGYSEGIDNHFSVAVQLRIPLYTGGVNAASYEIARAQRRMLQQTLTGAMRQVRQSTQQLHNTAVSIIEQERLLQSTIDVRQALLDKTRLAWLEGVRLTQDVIDAEQSLYDSRLRQRLLYYRYLGVLTQLRELSGDIDEEFLQRLDSYFE